MCRVSCITNTTTYKLWQFKPSAKFNKVYHIPFQPIKDSLLFRKFPDHALTFS